MPLLCMPTPYPKHHPGDSLQYKKYSPNVVTSMTAALVHAFLISCLVYCSNILPYFSDYKTHFPAPNSGGKGVCVLQSKCSFPGSLGRGSTGGRAVVEQGFFFLFSSPKTQVYLMVWCILQSEKHGTWFLSFQTCKLPFYSPYGSYNNSYVTKIRQNYFSG